MSDSTQALTTAARTRLLSFAPLSGATLDTRLGGRLYIVQAPADAVYPYGVLRLMNRMQSEGYQNVRETGDLELLLLHRGRAHQWEVEEALDVADQAMLGWWDTATGARWARHRVRDMLPAAPDPMDRELVVGRWVMGFTHWPHYLTQYLDA
jgi:hypothetical protein